MLSASRLPSYPHFPNIAWPRPFEQLSLKFCRQKQPDISSYYSSLYTSANKARIQPFFYSLKTSIYFHILTSFFNSFGMFRFLNYTSIKKGNTTTVLPYNLVLLLWFLNLGSGDHASGTCVHRPLAGKIQRVWIRLPTNQTSLISKTQRKTLSPVLDKFFFLNHKYLMFHFNMFCGTKYLS